MSKSWTITGRILPERVDANFGPLSVELKTKDNSGNVKLTLSRSLIHVRVDYEAPEENWYNAIDAASLVSSAFADYIAFKNRGYYIHVWDMAITENGSAYTIPINEPFFEHKKPGYAFDPTNRGIPQGFRPHPQLITAFHYTGQAVRNPSRTFAYCGLATEAIRHYFDPPTRRWRQRYAAGEAAMCDKLMIDAKALKKLIEGNAAPNRHGEPAEHSSWTLRKQVLEFTWEICARFDWLLHEKDLSGLVLLGEQALSFDAPDQQVEITPATKP